MSDRFIDPGDKFHIITRRLFDDDVRRHFAGEITAVSDNLVEIRGYLFVFNSGMNEYRRRPGLRARIFSFGDAGHIVNKLPREVDLASFEYRMEGGRLVVGDASGFILDINEFGPMA